MFLYALSICITGVVLIAAFAQSAYNAFVFLYPVS